MFRPKAAFTGNDEVFILVKKISRGPKHHTYQPKNCAIINVENVGIHLGTDHTRCEINDAL